jgi:CelD/BcsL family acetyltransferase involved in cellulose biosynthesis
MTMAAAIGDETARTVATPHAATIARVETFDSFAAAERDWRVFESPAQIATPYQRFDVANTWQNTVGVELGVKPLVTIAYDSEKRPVMVLPLVTRSIGLCRIACFPGGKHSNFNMPLWRREFAATATRADVLRILSLMSEREPSLDVLALNQQPPSWNGVANPLMQLPYQPSINECPLLTIDPQAEPSAWISGSSRRKLNGKERKLQALPGYRHIVARTEADVTRLLDAFFAIKPLRMAEQKIRNVFAEPGTEQFIRQACLTGLDDGKPAIELHGLDCDTEVIAVFAGVGDGYRFSTMFNTYTLSEAARHSPGLVLLRSIIDHRITQGYSSFDCGIGTDDYKLHFCKERQPLFDSFIPLTMKGHLAALALSTEIRIKRSVKQSPAAMKLLQPLREWFG